MTRYAGDEFAVILPDADARQALDVGERVRSGAAGVAGAAGLPAGEAVTLSIGVVTRPAGQWDARRTVELADDALYRAKQAGRDRVEVSPAQADVRLLPGPNESRLFAGPPAGHLVGVGGGLQAGGCRRAGFRFGVQPERFAPEPQRLLAVGLDGGGLLVLLAGRKEYVVGLFRGIVMAWWQSAVPQLNSASCMSGSTARACRNFWSAASNRASAWSPALSLAWWKRAMPQVSRAS